MPRTNRKQKKSRAIPGRTFETEFNYSMKDNSYIAVKSANGTRLVFQNKISALNYIDCIVKIQNVTFHSTEHEETWHAVYKGEPGMRESDEEFLNSHCTSYKNSPERSLFWVKPPVAHRKEEALDGHQFFVYTYSLDM